MNVIPTIRQWNLTTAICDESQNRLSIIWTLLGLLVVAVGIIFFLLTFVVIFKRRFKTFHVRDIFQREGGEIVLQRCS